MEIIIIGGNAAGMSAAARIARKACGAHHVVVIERSGEVSYGACGLPYYVGGTIKDADLMRIRTAEEFRRQGIDLRLYNTVMEVDFDRRTVKVEDTPDKKTAELPYDKLIITSGAAPILPPVEGAQLAGVYRLKTLAEGEALKAALTSKAVKDVAIVGGGYIGVELAEACIALGKRVRVFEALPRIMAGFDEEFGDAAALELRGAGAEMHTGEPLAAVLGATRAEGVRTAAGEYKADIVIFAVGVRPETGFVPKGALDMLPNGAIITNARMETSRPDVYAAGDCATVMHKILKAPAYIPLGTNANKQGRLVADVILGRDARYDNALGTAMLRCVTLEMAKTGATEAQAQEAGYDAASVTVQALSHAPYYPNPVDVTIKLCYDKGSKVILGAQLMGKGESAWRIDVLACAVDRGMRTDELGQLDLGYAPPFSGVWDAVHIAANAAR